MGEVKTTFTCNYCLCNRVTIMVGCTETSCPECDAYFEDICGVIVMVKSGRKLPFIKRYKLKG